MGLGEYVSVSSQRDSEHADIAKERWELENVPDRELAELTAIYQEKGLGHDLARQVAIELTEHDALQTHLAEELGHHRDRRCARPLQAAASSTLSFAIGAALPLLAAALVSDTVASRSRWWSPPSPWWCWASSAPPWAAPSPGRPTARVVVGGVLAMARDHAHRLAVRRRRRLTD